MTNRWVALSYYGTVGRLKKTAVLEEAIAQFEEINPEVDVIVVDLPSEADSRRLQTRRV